CSARNRLQACFLSESPGGDARRKSPKSRAYKGIPMADTHGDKPNCSICGSPAAVQLVKIRRGRETEEIQVCHDCRMLIGLGPDTPNMPFDVGDFFIPLPDDLDASIVCPACGRPLHEI